MYINCTSHCRPDPSLCKKAVKWPEPSPDRLVSHLFPKFGDFCLPHRHPLWRWHICCCFPCLPFCLSSNFTSPPSSLSPIFPCCSLYLPGSSWLWPKLPCISMKHDMVAQPTLAAFALVTKIFSSELILCRPGLPEARDLFTLSAEGRIPSLARLVYFRSSEARA